MNDHDDIDARLGDLAERTKDVGPRRGFTARVMSALPIAQRSWMDDVWASSRRFVPVAALAAAIGVVWAVTSDKAFDDAVAGYDDASDVGGW